MMLKNIPSTCEISLHTYYSPVTLYYSSHGWELPAKGRLYLELRMMWHYCNFEKLKPQTSPIFRSSHYLQAGGGSILCTLILFCISLNTILRVSITFISSVKVLAADDPGQIVHTLDHWLIGVDLKHDTWRVTMTHCEVVLHHCRGARGQMWGEAGGL